MVLPRPLPLANRLSLRGLARLRDLLDMVPRRGLLDLARLRVVDLVRLRVVADLVRLQVVVDSAHLQVVVDLVRLLDLVRLRVVGEGLARRHLRRPLGRLQGLQVVDMVPRRLRLGLARHLAHLRRLGLAHRLVRLDLARPPARLDSVHRRLRLVLGRLQSLRLDLDHHLSQRSHRLQDRLDLDLLRSLLRVVIRLRRVVDLGLRPRLLRRWVETAVSVLRRRLRILGLASTKILSADVEARVCPRLFLAIHLLLLEEALEVFLPKKVDERLRAFSSATKTTRLGSFGRYGKAETASAVRTPDRSSTSRSRTARLPLITRRSTARAEGLSCTTSARPTALSTTKMPLVSRVGASFEMATRSASAASASSRSS